MASKTDSTSPEPENLCVVCFKSVDIYSVGICDHPVCYECSTRMRVLCCQNECPICRGHMPKVIFTREVALFNELFKKYEQTNWQDKKYGLLFASQDIQKEYQQLLEFRCDICGDRKFTIFQQLKDHMRREHSLSYCDLCVENLKIFCFERRCYTRQELGYHRRKGDPDNTSHRGHPLCEFCDTRFVDRDELFRHLRRNHLFCHFCDADGKDQYYDTMENLKRHFHDEHYLCEEGECKNMPLTAVFKTDIDLKVHIATAHGRFMSKSATKQARTLELEFTLAPRIRPDRRKPFRIEEEGAVGYDLEPGGGPGGGGGGGSNSNNNNSNLFMNTLKPQDFPALGNSSVVQQTRPLSTTVNFTSKVPFSGDDFPSLGGPSRSSAVTITTNSSTNNNGNKKSKSGPEVTITRTIKGGQQKDIKIDNENFPKLGSTFSSTNNPSTSGTSTVRLSLNNTNPKVSIHVNQNVNGAITTHITAMSIKNENFPALSKNKIKQITPKWVQQEKKVENPTKVVEKPQNIIKPNDLSQFPSLKKSASVTVPVKWVETKKKPIVELAQKNDTNKIKNKTKKKSALETNNNEQVQTIVKRSELKIGNLTLNEPSTTGTPPPGFPKKLPPGLNLLNFPNLNNDLTFTNSSGESYQIKPIEMNYYQPKNFTIRNQNLIKQFKSVLKNDLIINEFKNYSDLFRNDKLTTNNYYQHCKSVMNDKFNCLFPELLVLLPDINKQQQLYKCYLNDNLNINNNLLVCEKCKQILFKNELTDHYTYHTLDNHFPTLQQNSAKSNVWKK